jgi:intracellular septation protein|tara:strand:- start:3813 stop:4391 length:579 start_codon:yes stop_codon:yes gene_type:complete
MNQIIKLFIEIGPVIVFITANSYYSDESGVGGAIPATKIFIVAMIISMICSKIFLKKITAMLWASSVLVGLFGGLAIYFDNEIFIKLKPTILYGLFSILLLGGVLTGRAFIRNVLEAGFPPMEDIAWMKMSRNWGLYFLGCALLNEYIWRNYSFEDWLWAKLWVFIPLSFVFAMAQMPIITKHLLEEENEEN